jgi:hypothetical protein
MSIYQDDPGKSHRAIVKTILKYLRRTTYMFLLYGGGNELGVKGYTDTSYLTELDDSYLKYGY